MRRREAAEPDRRTPDPESVAEGRRGDGGSGTADGKSAWRRRAGLAVEDWARGGGLGLTVEQWTPGGGLGVAAEGRARGGGLGVAAEGRARGGGMGVAAEECQWAALLWGA
jgi:hypothetical protein